MKETTSLSAFPYVVNNREPDLSISIGLSKRELVAALLLQGILMKGTPEDIKVAVKTAVLSADHLLKELNEDV